MAKIIPFQGLRYNPATVEMQEVVAPPYDVISAEQRDILYQRHQYNIVRLTNTKDSPAAGAQENKYVRARRDLEDWIHTGVLLRDEQPSIYVYEQHYKYRDNAPHLRRGFIALARLEDNENGMILGHEQTHMSAKYDRLNLIKECKANLSPIFSLYSQPDGSIDALLQEVAATPAKYDFVDDAEVRHRFWRVHETSFIGRLTREMTDKTLIIADGHHRYETALIYRHIRKSEKKSSVDEPYDYVMMMFVNLDSGVTIYPIHRIILNVEDFNPDDFRERLKEYFEIERIPFNCSNCEKATKSVLMQMGVDGGNRHTFGLYLGGESLEILKSRDDTRLHQLVEEKHCESFRRLDVAIAQAVILQRILGVDMATISREEHVRYTPSEVTALEAVRRGEAQAALLLNPTKPEQVRAVTCEGEKMPQKSTFFYPKLLSGLVINRFSF